MARNKWLKNWQNPFNIQILGLGPKSQVRTKWTRNIRKIP